MRGSSACVLMAVTQLGVALGSCSEPQTPNLDVIEQAITINYYVSPSGSGTQCKSNSPCSIATAKAKVQAAAPTMSGDINVFLKTGTYVLTAPLSFGPADSGQNGYTVIWQADTGATPIISGERVITGWTLYDASKNIWRATATSLNTRQLYVNGVRAERARSISEPLKYSKTSTGFTTQDNLALFAFARPSDLEVSSYSSWKHFRCPVASLTAGSFQNQVYKSVNDTGFQAMGSWTPDGVGDVVRQTGDFNGDGYSDLLHKYYSNGWHNQVYLSNGSGFVPAGDWLPGSGSPSYVGDFNGDGKDDLLFPYLDGPTWRNVVALSNGSSFYWPANPDWLSNMGQGVSYRVGDFNGDLKDDLLFAYSDGTNWHNVVALSTGSSFVNAGDWAPGSGVGTSYSTGDWNGDGRKDLLFSYSDGTNWHNTVALSTGNAFWFPTPSDWLTNGGQGTTYYVGDWNGDLRDDLLFAYSDSNGWHNTVALSNGTSQFLYPTPSDWLPQIGEGLTYLIGDFTGDVKKDLLFAGRETVISIAEPCWTNSQTRHPLMPLNQVTWLENAYELLDQSGEWYYDKVTNTVYYKPRPGENMSTATVIAPVIETLISGSGTLDGSGNPVFVHDIQFKNVTFSYNTWIGPNTANGYVELQAGWHYEGTAAQQPNYVRSPAAVTFSRAQRIKFERNKFRKLGSVAINFDTGSKDNSIIGNHFTDVSHTAIQIGDVFDAGETSLPKQTTGNLVKDNYISGVASEYKSGVGVFFGYSKDGTVARNEISNLPYTGISMGWGWGQTSYAYQNSVTQNFVHDVVGTLRDGGAVYTLSPQPQTTIAGNYLKAVPNDVGLYFDEGSQNIIATDNVVDSPYAFWMTMWRSSVMYNVVQYNWARTDVALCNGTTPTSSPACNFGFNVVNTNTFTTESWPSPAQAIITAAGIEPAYADIKTW